MLRRQPARPETGGRAAVTATATKSATPAVMSTDAANLPAAVSSMRHPRDPEADGQVLLGALGRLWLEGAEIDWSGDPWHALTGALKASSGRSGKGLFLPLRRALTGLDHGPDMKVLLPLIGRERAIQRLHKD